MRRLIAYIVTALAMLLAIGVAATPTITNLNSGREFTSGRNYREVVFNIATDENAANNENPAEKVAEKMRKRLDDYNVEDYSLKVQGNDTIALALDRTQTEFNYAAKYVSFSGGSFAFVASNGTVKNENELFKPEDLRLEYKGDAKVPVIIIPLTEKGKEDIVALSNELDNAEVSDDEDDSGDDYIYLWANFDVENDSYEDFQKDPLLKEKVLMAFNPSNLWWEESKEDKKETELWYMVASGTEEDPEQLDVNSLEINNVRANYLMSMLKADKYDYEISCPTAVITESGVDYYSSARVLNASSETLIEIGNNLVIKLSSKTFIAIAIAVAIVSLLLIVYYRLVALAIITTTLGTLFITLVSFVSMHVMFNIPAIIGFVCLTGGALFGEILYANRFKEEVYKGRTIKKANQEASRKSNLLTIDSAVILAFAGLMIYALGKAALKPMGVVLFFGAIFVILMNLLVFKLLMYLVTNSTNLQNKYKVFNIDGDKVPNIMSTEEKPAYEAPYEKVDFTKKKSIISIIFGALSAAALACIIVFGAISPTKSPLNIEKATSETTVIYAQVRIEGEKTLIEDKASFVKYVLDGTEDYISTKGIEECIDYKEVSRYEYNSIEDPVTIKYYFFTVNLDTKVDNIEDFELLLRENIYKNYEDDGITTVNVRTSQELVYSPNQGRVALATGLTIVGVALYCAFRFRPSRGIALLVTTTGATMIAYGLMVALRFIGTTALTSLAMPVVAITMMLASLFYLSTEKSMLKEGHLELTREVRKDIMVKALGKSASAMFIFMLVCGYIIINFFGFGVEATALLFASTIIGYIVAVVALLSVMGPLAIAIEKLFSKIHLPKIKWFNKEKPKQQVKRNSSEPEETIFIGIND